MKPAIAWAAFSSLGFLLLPIESSADAAAAKTFTKLTSSSQVILAADNRGVYVPQPGDAERKALMDAIRLAHCIDATYKVDFLKVLRKGERAIAIAEVWNAAQDSECGGVFLLIGLRSQWRAMAFVGGGGGASTCTDAKELHDFMIETIENFGAPKSILPASFWTTYKEAHDGAADTGCALAEKP